MRRLSRGEFAELNQLRRSAARQEQGRVVVPGYKCITELVRGGHRIEQLLICGDTTAAAEQTLGPVLWQQLQREDRVCQLRDHEAARLADQASPEGLLAVTQLPQIDTSLRPRVILDGVADPGNLGSILRTALWFGLEPVGLLGGADPWSPRVIRSAMGSQFHLRLRVMQTDDVAALRDGRRLLGLDSNGGSPLNVIQPQAGDTLVLGSESHGLLQTESVLSERVWIPGTDRAESLNVGHAFAICAWHFYRDHHNG